MKNTLYIFPVSDVGGAETVMLNFLSASADSRPALVALLSDKEGPLCQRLSQLKIPWVRFRRGKMRNLLQLFRCCFQVRRLILNHSIETIFSNSAQGYLYGRWAAVGLKASHLLYYMTVPNGKIWRNGPLEWLLKIVPPSRTLVPSRIIQQTLECWGFRGVFLVPHGTLKECATEDEIKFRDKCLEEWNVSSDDLLILVPGRLQSWKGQHVFLSAFARIRQKLPKVHAVLCGDALFDRETEYPTLLKEMVRQLELTPLVHFAGHRPIWAWLERSQLVVHASLTPDAFPNVCLESMAAEKPLITTSGSGVCDILRHGIDAVVVPPNDPQALAAAAIEVLTDKEFSRSLAESGHQQYLAHCTRDHMVRKIDEILERL